MSVESETGHLTFPWDGQMPAQEIVTVRDVDIVGVGAKRRQQLQQISAVRKVILQAHTGMIPDVVRGIYDQELLNTINWLRPFQTTVGPAFDFNEEEKRLFPKIFPLTEKSLGLASAKVRDSYLEEMQWSSWLLQDHWRYFVGHLRRLFPTNTELRELVHWEWVYAWLEIQPFEALQNLEKTYINVNPSLQTVPLSVYNSALDREAGLYAFVYSVKHGQIMEKKLSVAEAQLIDLLNEDRKYTEQQLVEMMLLEQKAESILSEEQIRRKISGLDYAEIISTGT